VNSSLPEQSIHTDEITLVEKRHEHGDIHTFVFSSETPIPFRAGQYVHMRLPNVPPPEKAVREFSFASAPSDPEIQFTVNTRSGSPYQEALRTLPIGGKAALFKIKGHMTIPEDPDTHLVLIGSGVGVAPFRSILRDILTRNRHPQATLIQVDRGDFLYQNEFSALPIEYRPIVREEIAGALERAVRDHSSAVYCIAGSPAFVEETMGRLTAVGLSLDQIQTDIFKGLHED
jgi:ferredoxin-NADP reductase